MKRGNSSVSGSISGDLVKPGELNSENLFSISEFGGQSAAQVANQCCIAGESERQDSGAGSVHVFHHARA